MNAVLLVGLALFSRAIFTSYDEKTTMSRNFKAISGHLARRQKQKKYCHLQSQHIKKAR